MAGRSERIRYAGPKQDSALTSIRDLQESRNLLWALTQRSIRARYKQSVLGMLWAVAHPLALMLIFTAVFSYILRIGSEGVPYPLFSYAGLLPWTFFATGCSLAMNSLVSNVDLVTRVRFSREVLPISSVLASLFDFTIALGIFFGILLFYGFTPTWHLVFLLPLITIQFVLTIGFSFLVAALNVRYRDIKYIVPLGFRVWMYACPIIYSLDAVPATIRPFYVWNPLVGLIEGYRAALVHGRIPDFGLMGISVLGAVFCLSVGWYYFHRVEIYFADII